MRTLPKVYGISSLPRLRSGYKNPAVQIVATITRVTSAIAIRAAPIPESSRNLSAILKNGDCDGLFPLRTTGGKDPAHDQSGR
jgi:hypothetical protein